MGKSWAFQCTTEGLIFISFRFLIMCTAVTDKVCPSFLGFVVAGEQREAVYMNAADADVM